MLFVYSSHLCGELAYFRLVFHIIRVKGDVDMHFVRLIGLDYLAHLDDLLLAQVELEKQVLHRRLVEAEAAQRFLFVEEFDQHVSCLVLHHEQLAVVDPTKE